MGGRAYGHARATDVIDRWAPPYTHQVKYDATPPEVEYDGRLASLHERSTAEDATLEIVARDGSATSPRSGVRSVNVHVDGALVQSTGDLSCRRARALRRSGRTSSGRRTTRSRLIGST